MSKEYKKVSAVNCYRSPFEIREAVGNNRFSFDTRENKRIFVPSLSYSSFADVKSGNKPAFIELNESGEEIISYGLESFIRDGKIYIFDNHNHCYYFYKSFLRENRIRSLGFIHVDQHKDMRAPSVTRSEYGAGLSDLSEALLSLGVTRNVCEDILEKASSSPEYVEEIKDFLYTNRILNVGNFIRPLLEEKKISFFCNVDSSYQMERFDWSLLDEDFALDIDLDFFSEDMDYISRERKNEFIRALVKRASVILIAFSPYFVTFDRAKRALFEILESE